MLCYRCGSHVPDFSERCGTCGQQLAAGGVGQATGTFSRRRPSNQSIQGAPFQAGALLAQRYLVKEVLAEGPLGYVFKAHDNEADVDVALKAIHPRLLQTKEERAIFSSTIRAGRKVAHPNVVRVYDDGEHQDWPFFTMQLLEGLTLRKIIDLRLAKNQFFTLREAEPIFAQMVSALEAIHEEGPHSDLKPQNVLVLPDLLKVSDVGLGLALPRMPFVQAMRGRKTDAYLAPEFVSDSEIDKRIDVYALGVMLGEMLSGQLVQDAVPELLQYNPELPREVEGLYRKAVNRNPLSRFQSPLEFQRALTNLAQKTPPPPQKAMSGAELTSPQVPPPPPIEASRPPPFPEEVVVSRLDELFPGEDGPVLHPIAPGSPVREETRPEGVVSALGRSKSRAAFWLVFLTVAGLLSGGLAGVYGLRKWKDLQRSDAPASDDAGVAENAHSDAGLGASKPVRTETPPRPSAAPDSVVFPASGAEELAKAIENTTVAPTPVCPDDMRLIPAGTFRMGASSDDPERGFDERTLASVSVPAFCIDVYEYPNSRGLPPRTGVTLADATRLCDAREKRLCREEEWEKACKGPSQFRFPYGNDFNPDACNTEDELGEDRTVSEAGEFPLCRSGYGVFDLSGNVAEWTTTLYSAGQDRAIKGGAFNRPDYAARCAARKNGGPQEVFPDVGFRCCADVK